MRRVGRIVTIVSVAILSNVICVYAFPISRDDLMMSTMYFMEQKMREKSIGEAFGGYGDSLLRNFHPLFALTQEYSDNIFFTHENPSIDNITTATPALLYKWNSSGQKTSLFLESGADFMLYAKNNKYNVINPYIEFSLQHSLRKYGFEMHYKLKKEQSTISELQVTESKSFQDHWLNDFSAQFDIDLNRFLWNIGYSHQGNLFQKDFKNRNTNNDDSCYFISNLKLLPKTYLYFEFEWGYLNYFRGGNLPNGTQSNVYNKYWLGINGEITSKIKGNIKLGEAYRNYRDTGKKTVTPDIGVTLDYQATRYLTYGFKFQDHVEATGYVDEGDAKTKRWGLSSAYTPPFSTRLKLIAGASYATSSYEDGRDNKRYDVNLTCEYQLRKWLKFQGKYSFTDNVSTMSDGSYKSNIISLGLDSEF